MTVNPDTALHAEREGQTHYFCSEECREQFLSASVVARRTDPCVIVIFGASGDLTSLKLLPSLCNLVASGLLTDDFAIIGVGRTECSDQDFREQMRSAVAEFAPQKVDAAIWNNIEERMRYCSGSYTDPDTYQRLSNLLSESDANHHTGGNALFYLSVPATTFAPIAQQLHASGLLSENPQAWRRVIVEKPFGHDLASARELNAALSSSMAESQIYRIDHYLGKETAQNLLVFRLGNSMIEPVWNRTFIDHVEITAAESIGIEGRAAFYETAGAFRDMMQTHMLIMLALITMEPPASLSGEAVHNEKRRCWKPCEFSYRTKSCETRSAGNKDRARSAEKTSPAIAKSRASPRSQRSRPMPPPSYGWIIGVGRACRSICAPARGSPGASRRSSSISSVRRSRCLVTRNAVHSAPTCSSCTSSPRRGSRCKFAPRCRDRAFARVP